MWYLIEAIVLILAAGYGGYAYGRKVQAAVSADLQKVLNKLQ